MRRKRLVISGMIVLLVIIVGVLFCVVVPDLVELSYGFFVEATPSSLSWDQSSSALVLRVGRSRSVCDTSNQNDAVRLWGDGRMIWQTGDEVGREEHLTTDQMRSLLRRAVAVLPSIQGIPGTPCYYIFASLVGWSRTRAEGELMRWPDPEAKCMESESGLAINNTSEEWEIPYCFFAFYDEVLDGVRELDTSEP